MLYYKDIVDGKIRRTFGQPDRVERGGIGGEGLIVKNKMTEMFIPKYLLVGASRNWFDEIKRKQEKVVY